MERASKKEYTVSQVNRYLARMMQEDFFLSHLTVSGEISNLKMHPSGHIYFTLKDQASQLSGIMFAGKRAGLGFRLENGMKVLCTGRIGLYEQGGSYQIYADSFQLAGQGDLYLRFEALKKELMEMGLFDPMYKKPIPKYARRIGVVTASSGAAVRDIVQIARRRNPFVEITLFPALVQGEGAVASIVRGIERLDKLGLDALIVGRGGGSIEDLWAFNEEAVAKAIFNAETPIISAVGHETDTTISDFVADLRAPTPSAAAELAVFDYMQFVDDLSSYTYSFHERIEKKILFLRQRLKEKELKFSVLHPKAILQGKQHRLLDLQNRLQNQMMKALQSAKENLQDYAHFAKIMERRLSEDKSRLSRYQSFPHLMEEKLLKLRHSLIRYQDFPHVMEEKLAESRHRMQLLSEQFDALSPLRLLSNGYSYVRDEEGHRVSSAGKLKKGELLELQFSDGSAKARVEEIESKSEQINRWHS